MSAYTFVSGKHEVTAQDVVRFPVLVAGPLFNSDPSVVRCFESDDDFLLWARTSNQGEKLVAAHEASVEVCNKYENSDHSDLRERQRQEFEAANADLRRTAEQAGVALNSPDLFDRLGWGHDPLNLYEHVSLGGDWGFFPAGPLGWPDFRWLNSAVGTWDDIASSGLPFGAGFLAEHTWFKGRKFYFGGFGWPFNLTDFDFNDQATSCWII